MNTTTYQQPQVIQIDLIRPSACQPRKRFDQFKLTELAKSIETRGVLQPILLRPVEMVDGVQYFEIVAGERRWRASRMANLLTVPSIVRSMSDIEAVELAVIENDQREDLHPIEQAEGYAQLLKAYGQTDATLQFIDELALKIGKSRSFIYGRLKLLALIPDAREACFNGVMSASIALLFARMPTEVQGKAYKRWTESESAGDQLSFRGTVKLLNREFMLRLETAPFPTADVTLLPEAGGCATCPKRTGASPDLFGDVEHNDTCTDPNCYDSKVAAHNQRRKDEARAQGIEVLENDSARVLLKFGESSTQLGGEYIYMDESLQDLTGSTQCIAKLLGTLLKPSALFEHPKDKTLREIVHVVKATDTLREHGLLLHPPVNTPASKPSPKPTGTSVATKRTQPEHEPSDSNTSRSELIKNTEFHLAWRTKAFRQYHYGLHDMGFGMPSRVRQMVAMELALESLYKPPALDLMVELWGWSLPAWPASGLEATMWPIIEKMNDDELDLLIAELVVLPSVFSSEINDWTPGSSLIEIAASDEAFDIDVLQIIHEAKHGSLIEKNRLKLPPAGDDKGAPAEGADKSAPEEETSQQAQGPEGIEGADVQAEAAATGQEGGQQLTHWVGQIVKIKGTKCVREVRAIAADGSVSVGVTGCGKGSKYLTTHASIELLVLPDQIRPAAVGIGGQ